MTEQEKNGRNENGKPSGDRHSYLWLIPGVVVLLMLIYGAYRATLFVMLHNEMEALAAKGYPVTLEDLDEWYASVPPDENAALVYMKAFKRYKEPSKKAFDLLMDPPEAGEGLSGETLAVARRHLSRNKEALKLLDKAAGMERCRYPLDFTQGGAPEMRYVRELRSAARLLKLESLVHASEGESGQVADSIIDIFGAAKSMKSVPDWTWQTPRMALEWEALHSFRRTAALTRLSEADLKRLAEAFQNAEKGAGRSMRRGLVGSMTETLHLDDKHLRHYMGPVGSGSTGAGHMLEEAHMRSVLLGVYALSGLKGLDRLKVASGIDRVAGIFDKPPSRRVGAARKVESDLTYVPDSRIGGQLHAVRAFALPPVSSAVVGHVRCLALLRAARVATAVERFRLDRGRLPEDLSELTTGYLETIPTDPFDGKPLRYLRRLDEYVIYSVGDDCKDDGGSSEHQNVRPDVAFSMQTPGGEGSPGSD